MRSIFRIVLLSVVVASPVVAETNAERDELQLAWNGFIAGLVEAQRSLFSPEFFPPEATDRNRAEGHRYLLGHIVRETELQMRADPLFPEFTRSVDMLRKWTGENPDTTYLKASIDDTGFYRVSGQVENAIEWRTSERTSGQMKAPRMITFQTITNFPGGTGKLAEMGNCRSQTLGFVNSFDLKLDQQNRFEFMVGPERPKGYKGSFLPSRSIVRCPSANEDRLERANWLAVRVIYADWDYEVPPLLDIVRLDSEGSSKSPITVEDMVERLDHMSKEIPSQVQFWQLLQALALEVNQDVNRDGRRNMPVNGINPPALPFTAGGVAGSKQLYAAGVFELEDDEALIVKVTAPIEPHYISLQLNNLWFEGPDQQNYVSSLTGHQLPVSSDGSRYYVITRNDPGINGWVATTGLKKGTHAMRFLFRDDPVAGQMPTAEAKLVKFADIGKHLPKGTPKVTVDQRRVEIANRQAHIKRRWRSY